MITFKYQSPATTSVYLESKTVGEIKKVKDGYQYRPKGAKKAFWGEVLPTVKGVKQSILGED